MRRKPAGVKPRPATGLLRISLISFMMVAMSGANSTPAEDADLENAVCGSWREPFMFWMWRSMAGAPNPQRLAGIKDVKPLQFKTRDGISLGGYKLTAAKAKGYLLVAQGNAMLADQLVADLQELRDLNLDVYVYDYRGYGNSQGKSRLAAIVADYQEIVAHLNSLGYVRRLLYGISMGGVILLNAAGKSRAYDRMTVDSSPSRISNLGCPERYDPVLQLPENGSRLMVISGARDSVVPPAQMEEMLRAARARGARVHEDAEFAHPFQDFSQAIHLRRQREVAAFLSRE